MTQPVSTAVGVGMKQEKGRTVGVEKRRQEEVSACKIRKKENGEEGRSIVPPTSLSPLSPSISLFIYFGLTGRGVLEVGLGTSLSLLRRLDRRSLFVPFPRG